MVGLFNCFGLLGCILYVIITGILVDKVDRSAMYVYLGVTDILMIALSLTLTCMGKLNSF